MSTYENVYKVSSFLSGMHFENKNTKIQINTASKMPVSKKHIPPIHSEFLYDNRQIQKCKRN